MPSADADPIQWTSDPKVWEGELEGRLYGSGVTIIFTRLTGPGGGPELHKHPYTETFVLRQGEVVFTVGDQQMRARAGQIIIAPQTRRTNSPMAAPGSSR
jgi:mannose-6-phosphate isomerase-like protein (cupin superfamily)